MNEFVVILKRLNIKNWKLKKKFLRNLKTQWLLKFSHYHSNLFSSTSKIQSKRIIEAEPTR